MATVNLSILLIYSAMVMKIAQMLEFVYKCPIIKPDLNLKGSRGYCQTCTGCLATTPSLLPFFMKS